jgi:hypothetical protein
VSDSSAPLSPILVPFGAPLPATVLTASAPSVCSGLRHRVHSVCVDAALKCLSFKTASTAWLRARGVPLDILCVLFVRAVKVIGTVHTLAATTFLQAYSFRSLQSRCTTGNSSKQVRAFDASSIAAIDEGWELGSPQSASCVLSISPITGGSSL